MYNNNVPKIGSKMDKLNHKFDEVKRPVFVGIFFIRHLLYFLVFLGVVYINSTYIRYMSILIQGFIGLFLIIRFHPYRTYAINRFDAMVIFASASFLMTNLITTELLGPYLPGIEDYLKRKVENIIGKHSFMQIGARIPSATPAALTTRIPTDIYDKN